ncbi:MAG TPA: MFS transporter [Ktedonobacter sp.]|nr:MFS transporter [Ktedonobacter sp.]
MNQASMQEGSVEVIAAKPVGRGMLRPFKVRNFNLLLSGQTISIIGDALYMVALPWLILTTGGNAQELGIVLAAYGIPRAASTLAGGWLSDHLRPRQLMLIADTVRMLLVGILAVLAFQGHPIFWQLCAIAVPLGALSGAFTPATLSIVPEILSSDDLQAGNGLWMSFLQGANLIGSAFAGVIVATLSTGGGLAIDAATFLASAVSLALMRTISHAHPFTSGKQEMAESQGLASIDTGEQSEQISFWHFLLTSRLIQATVLMFMVISIVSGGVIEVALPTLVHGPFHSSASSYGFIMAGWGAGSLIGSVFAGMLGQYKHKGMAVLLAGLIVSAAIALLPTWGVIGAIACMLIGGLANSGVTVLLFTAIQLAIPRHLMGRIMGLLMFSASGLYPFSVALAGVLSNHFGPAILFPFGGLLLALVMLFGMTQKALREI